MLTFFITIVIIGSYFGLVVWITDLQCDIKDLRSDLSEHKRAIRHLSSRIRSVEAGAMKALDQNIRTLSLITRLQELIELQSKISKLNQQVHEPDN